MRSKLLEQHPRTYVLIFNTGDELADGLAQFAAEEKIGGSSFKAIGALSAVKLGWFNWESKKYEVSVDLNEQVELVSLIGDVAEKDGKPQVHAHVVIGRRDGTAHGGHLMSATVRPTCEVILTESPTHLEKKFDPESGIALIRV
jgi:predicted DNA-binding protein with PD1-like motif